MFLTSCAVVYVIITTFATVTESFTFLSRKTLSTKIFSRSLEVFENGWENNGVSVINAKHAVVVYGNTEVRGLVAIESISTNDAIVSLPESNCLAVPEVVSGAVPGTIEAEAPTVRLAVFLLKEWLKGETSTYSNYISFLPEPKSVNTPLHWPSELISKFPYAFMVLSVNRQVQRWNVLYDKFIANNPNLPGATKERFIWAMEMVGSRAFEGVSGLNLKTSLPVVSISLLIAIAVAYQTSLLADNSVIIASTIALSATLVLANQRESLNCVLLPIIDSCNHRGVGCNSAFDFSPFQGKFVLKSLQAIQKGSEITITYGERHNDELLQFYGFVEENNKYDRYVIVDAKNKIRLLEDNTEESTLGSGMNAIFEQILQNSTQDYKDDSIVIKGDILVDWSFGKNVESYKQRNVLLQKLIRLEKSFMTEKLKSYAEFLNSQDINDKHSLVALGNQFFSAKLSLLDSAMSAL